MTRTLILTLCSLFVLQSCEQTTSIKAKTEKISIVEANGELASSETVIISPPFVNQQWQYKITFIVPEGSNAKKGQPIIRFDNSQIAQKLSVKQSELNTSKKALENIYLTTKAEQEKQKLDLAEAIMKQDKSERKWKNSKGLESRLEVKKLSVQYQLAKNEAKRLERILNKSEQATKVKIAIEESKVERLQIESTELQAGLQKMTITSPKDGIVMYMPDFNGNKISSGDTVWRGRQLIELPSIDQMIIKGQILEADAGKVSVGQNVEVILDAIPERVFKGKISQLGKIFRRKSNEQANIILDADIMLNDPDVSLMRPGMATRIKVMINEE